MTFDVRGKSPKMPRLNGLGFLFEGGITRVSITAILFEIWKA